MDNLQKRIFHFILDEVKEFVKDKIEKGGYQPRFELTESKHSMILAVGIDGTSEDFLVGISGNKPPRISYWVYDEVTDSHVAVGNPLTEFDLSQAVERLILIAGGAK